MLTFWIEKENKSITTESNTETEPERLSEIQVSNKYMTQSIK